MPVAPTRFRLLTPLPATVVFSSVTYRLEIVEAEVSHEWRFIATDEVSRAFWLLAVVRSELHLLWDLRVRGVVLRPEQLAFTIFRRLEREGRAEVVTTAELHEDEPTAVEISAGPKLEGPERDGEVIAAPGVPRVHLGSASATHQHREPPQVPAKWAIVPPDNLVGCSQSGAQRNLSQRK